MAAIFTSNRFKALIIICHREGQDVAKRIDGEGRRDRVGVQTAGGWRDSCYTHDGELVPGEIQFVGDAGNLTARTR